MPFETPPSVRQPLPPGDFLAKPPTPRDDHATDLAITPMLEKYADDDGGGMPPTAVPVGVAGSVAWADEAVFPNKAPSRRGSQQDAALGDGDLLPLAEEARPFSVFRRAIFGGPFQ